jgi:hypothetical protein
MVDGAIGGIAGGSIFGPIEALILGNVVVPDLKRTLFTL